MRARTSLLANLLTGARIPLAALLWIAPADPRWFLSVLGLAALTDLLDGWLARRLRRRLFLDGDPGALSAGSNPGAVLDPIADKVFTVSAVVAVFVSYDPALPYAVLVLTREILMVPLLGFAKLVPGPWQRPRDYSAGWPGKLTTVVQWTALLVAVVLPRFFPAIAVVAAASGGLAAAFYARRASRPS